MTAFLLGLLIYFVSTLVVMVLFKKITYVDNDGDESILGFRNDDQRKFTVVSLAVVWPLSLMASAVILPVVAVCKIYDKIK